MKDSPKRFPFRKLSMNDLINTNRFVVIEPRNALYMQIPVSSDMKWFVLRYFCLHKFRPGEWTTSFDDEFAVDLEEIKTIEELKIHLDLAGYGILAHKVLDREEQYEIIDTLSLISAYLIYDPYG